jgi:molybdopterin/thiamine biosynthesis adenylyltransferase
MTRRIALAMPEPLWDELRRPLDEADERAGILIGTLIEDEHSTFFAQRIEWSPDSTYNHRTGDQILLTSEGWAPTVRRARRDGHAAAFVHTHPRGCAAFSARDDTCDGSIASTHHRLAGHDLFSVVIAGTSDAPSIVARTVRPTGERATVDVIRIAGRRLQILPATSPDLPTDLHDRQIRALGHDGLAILSSLRVGVVGLGGTGSPVVEMLQRLGVRHIVAIDDDIVTEATPSRGAFYSARHLGQPKTEVIADMTSHLDLGCTLETVVGDITHPDVSRRLRHCDVVFSCTDGHAGRVPVNRLPYWLLAPVIDIGVLVASRGPALPPEVTGRVTWLAPSTACLLCRDRIDPHIAAAEALDGDERRALAGEGYVPELQSPQPSVVAYTTMVASYAIDELLRRLFFEDGAGASEWMLQIDQRRFRSNAVQPQEGCRVCANRTNWGEGGLEPWLGMAAW